MPTEEWQTISADSAPPGVYVPNMSEDDRLAWKAKLVGVKVGHPSIEIRKSTRMTQIVIVVTMGGFRDNYGNGMEVKYHPEYNIKISQNGSAMYSWDDFADLQAAIAEAKQVLESL